MLAAFDLSILYTIPFLRAALYINTVFSSDFGASGILMSITKRSMLPGVVGVAVMAQK
jgi:hypothetical protein